MSKHLRLTNEQFLHLHHTLTTSQFNTYLFLSTLNPFADRQIEVDTAVISEHLGITRRSVQMALNKLNKLGLIDWEVTKSKVRIFTPKSENEAAKSDDKGDPVFRQGDPVFRQGDPVFRQGDPVFRQDVPEALPVNDSGSPQTINTINTIQTLSNCARENLREERLENFDQEKNEKNVESVEQTLKIVQEGILQNSEKPLTQFEEQIYSCTDEAIASGNKQIEKPLESGRQAQQEDRQQENSNREATSNIQNPEDGQISAAPPKKFFKTLRDFVIYEAKKDPKINSPEIWANTCLARNREEWQAKWDAWERSRTQTVVGLPEKVEIDFEASKKALEEARKLLPAWMRANRG